MPVNVGDVLEETQAKLWACSIAILKVEFGHALTTGPDNKVLEG
jgi:hypothetical protein